MSIVDTSYADPISHLSPWEQMYSRLVEAREVANDLLRRELDAQPAKPRTVADIEDDIRRYTKQQTVPAVIHCLPWLLDVQAKLATAKTELATAQAGGVL